MISWLIWTEQKIVYKSWLLSPGIVQTRVWFTLINIHTAVSVCKTWQTVTAIVPRTIGTCCIIHAHFLTALINVYTWGACNNKKWCQRSVNHGVSLTQQFTKWVVLPTWGQLEDSMKKKGNEGEKIAAGGIRTQKGKKTGVGVEEDH